MKPSLNKIVLYVKNVEKTVTFYEKYFGYKAHAEEGDRIIELMPSFGGASLMVHQAGKGIREGQACVKLVFDIKDVESFRTKCAKNGLKFGAVHKADGYIYSNAKDPGKNSIQISSRAYRKSA